MVLSVVFLAEIPCILRTVALQLKTDGIWQVIFGTLVGSGLALAVGIGIALLISREIPVEYANWVQYCSGAAIIFIGLMVLLKGH